MTGRDPRKGVKKRKRKNGKRWRSECPIPAFTQTLTGGMPRVREKNRPRRGGARAPIQEESRKGGGEPQITYSNLSSIDKNGPVGGGLKTCRRK